MWFEVAVVLALTWLPFMYGSVSWIVWPTAESPSFSYDMLSHMVRAMHVIVPLLYVIWRSGDRWSEFGIKRVRPLVDSLLAGGLLIVDLVAYHTFWMLAGALFGWTAATADAVFDEIFVRPKGAADHVVLLFGCLAIGAYEEMTMRGFLIPRLEALLGSSGKAVLVSTIIFTSYHIYQHPLGVVTVFITGVIFGAAFCLMRRVWPLIVAHAAIDAISYTWT